MANEPNQSPLLPPEPWYNSELYVKGAIALGVQAISILLRIIGRWVEIDVDMEAINASAADLTQWVAAYFGYKVLTSRAASPIQPLTLTKASADAKADTALLDPRTMAPKTEGPAALAAAQTAGKQPDSAAADLATAADRDDTH